MTTVVPLMSTPRWSNIRAMSRQDAQFKLRMPAELRDAIERAAANAKRSLNAEIVARLESTTSLDDSLAERSLGDLDHSSILSWIEYIEGLNVAQREELVELRNNPVVIDGGELAKQVAASVLTPGVKSIITFLALQAAYPELVTDFHKQRVAIFASRVAEIEGQNDPKQILEALTRQMMTEAFEIDLGL